MRQRHKVSVFSPCSSVEPSAELFRRKCNSVINLTVCEHPNVDTQNASITVHILFVSATVYKHMVEVHIKRFFFWGGGVVGGWECGILVSYKCLQHSCEI